MARTFLLTILWAAAVQAAGAERLPPPPEQPPNIHALRQIGARPIFTYTVDGQCRVARTHKLQGADNVTWNTVQSERGIYRQSTAWQYIDGVRRQLHERRVKLEGEMVRPGELVCRVLPSGDVVDAWIERPGAKGQRPTREPVPVARGRIGSLGTFSVVLDPHKEAS